MNPFSILWRWLRSLGQRRAVKQEIDEELRFHLEQRTAENIAAGMSPEDAAREARRRFGNVQSVREECRDARRASFGETMMQDIRFGLRMLCKNPGFTAIVVLVLGLGIGGNTAIFTLLDHMVMRSLPVPKAEELMVVTEPFVFSHPIYRRLCDLNTFCTEMAGTHRLSAMLISTPGQAEGLAEGCLVSGNYFAALGVRPLLGRTILPADDQVAESSPVAVISYSFWQRAFNGNPDVLGRKIRVRSRAGYANTGGLDIYDGDARSAEGAVLTIVGVTPPGFFGDTIGVSTDVWMPIMMQPAVMPGRPWLDKNNARWVEILGRLKPGVDPQQATAAMTVLWRQILTDEAGANLTEDWKRSIAQQVLKVEPGAKGFGGYRDYFAPSLRILMTVVALVLLIACLNVANLLMARGNTRQREIGLRLALGSGRWRLIRQLLTESLLLGALGGLLGLLIAFAVTKLLVALASSGYQPVHLSVQPDLRTFAFTAALSGLTTLLFGLAPAVRATRVRLADTLKDAARGTMSRQRSAAAKSLVAVQVGLSMVLLIGASLLVKTLYNLRTQNVGYDPNHLIMLTLDPVSSGYHGDDIGRVCKNMLDRIAVLPGVRAVTFSENGLFCGTESGINVEVEGFSSGPEDKLNAGFDQIGPGYFSSLGIPLLLGREITERDGPTAPRVAVINETMAKFYFADGNAIGKHIAGQIGRHPFKLEIVGVARDIQDHSFWSKPIRRFYVSYFQPIDGITAANFAIRTEENPGIFAETLRREVRSADPRLMVQNIRDLNSLMDQSLVQTRMLTHLSASFGLLAVLLAVIGLYGVVSHEVVQRTGEIGIRMALGARRRDVLFLFLGNSLKVIAVGLALGTALAFALARVLRTFLFEVEPTDPATFARMAILFTAVALLACYIPARRATKIDPMTALRYE